MEFIYLAVTVLTRKKISEERVTIECLQLFILTVAASSDSRATPTLMNCKDFCKNMCKKIEIILMFLQTMIGQEG